MFTLILLLASVVFMLLLIAGLKLNAFLALLITALLVGLCYGMEPLAVVKAIQDGVGSTMGSIALIIALGALLGKMLETSGAAFQITKTLTEKLGEKRLPLTLTITGFIVGIPMIYNAGFLVLIPLLYSFTISSGRPLLFLGISMCSSLSVAHAFLPPHPAITSVAGIYVADINKILLYGLIIAIPAIFIAGRLFARFFLNSTVTIPMHLFNPPEFKENALPSFSTSILIALLPVVLMVTAGVSELFLPKTSLAISGIKFLGNPIVALLIAALAACYWLGIKTGKPMKQIMEDVSKAIGSIGMILLIIAAGGAFKEVLVQSGIGKEIGEMSMNLPLSPLVLAWTTAALLRIALGSATVAAITAAGMMLPLLSRPGVNPELFVLATASGSLMFSHVNDVGFWMFKEYFNLNIKQTFQSWTMMENLVAITGLTGCLIIDAII